MDLLYARGVKLILVWGPAAHLEEGQNNPPKKQLKSHSYDKLVHSVSLKILVCAKKHTVSQITADLQITV